MRTIMIYIICTSLYVPVVLSKKKKQINFRNLIVNDPFAVHAQYEIFYEIFRLI